MSGNVCVPVNNIFVTFLIDLISSLLAIVFTKAHFYTSIFVFTAFNLHSVWKRTPGNILINLLLYKILIHPNSLVK